MNATTYSVEVGWTGATLGLFTLGSSTLGGTDTLAGIFGSTSFDAITADVQEISIIRGRTDDLARMQAGTCTIELLDTTGKYSPEKAESPLAGLLVPMRPIRVQAVRGGITYPRFSGFITDIESNPDARRAVIQATDLFIQLGGDDGAKPVIAASGPTTTGAAIGRVLDTVGWTDSSMRSLNTGDTLPAFSADGTLSALDLIAGLLLTERGMFMIRGDGVAVYRDRHAGNRAPYTTPQSTLVGNLRAVAPGVHLSQVRNRARVTRTGGSEQVATDDASRRLYGYRDYSPIVSAYLQSDTQALSLARHLVTQRKDPRSTARSLELSGIAPGALDALLAREIGDHVSVTEVTTGMSGSYIIERIEERISAVRQTHTGAWVLSRRPAAQPFILGTSTLGGSHVFTF